MDFFKKIIDLAEEVTALDGRLLMIGDPVTGKLFKIKKENVILGGVSGSGTVGTVPLWGSATGLGNSAITQDANYIKITSRRIHIDSPGGASSIYFGPISAQNQIYHTDSDGIHYRSNGGKHSFQSWGATSIGEFSGSVFRFNRFIGTGVRLLQAAADGSVTGNAEITTSGPSIIFGNAGGVNSIRMFNPAKTAYAIDLSSDASGNGYLHSVGTLQLFSSTAKIKFSNFVGTGTRATAFNAAGELTVLPIKFNTTITDYADNAAAVAAGLAVGTTYHTAGVLKIVI